MIKAIGRQANSNQTWQVYVLKAWFWCTIRCMKLLAKKARPEVVKNTYLILNTKHLWGIKKQKDDKSLRWKILSI